MVDMEYTKEEIQKAIEALRENCRSMFTPEEIIKAIKIAVYAMNKTNAEPCSKCSGRYDFVVKPCANGDQRIEAKIIDGGLVLFYFGMALGYIDAKYCPECGRKLTE